MSTTLSFPPFLLPHFELNLILFVFGKTHTHTHKRRKACIIHRFIVANHGRSPQLQSLWNDNRWTMCQSDDGSCNGNNRRRPTMSNDCLLAETRTLAHFRSRPIVIASRINNCLKVFVCMYVYNGCVCVCVCWYICCCIPIQIILVWLWL